MTLIYPRVHENVACYLKMMIDNRNDWPSHFLQSEDVFCKNPSTLFNTQEPLILHDGRYFFVKRNVDSGKTDGCESGCWRIMGRDKMIKSKVNGKILGLKKVYKFCEKEEKPKSVFMFWEKEKRRVRDQRIWVMEEYRLTNQWKQDYVICKIRFLNPDPLEFMLAIHVRGYCYR